MSRTLVRTGQAAPAAAPVPGPTTSTATVVKNPAAAAPAPAAATPAAPQASDSNLSRLIHGAAAATLIYGDTGSGKTTLLATYAEWVWRTFHVPTRLYACDPGGYSDDILALIRLGIIEVWRMYTRDPLAERGLPSETLQRACQGWWPAEIDPASGECPAGVPMVSPDPTERFAVAYDGLTSMQDYSMVDMGARAAKGILGGEGSNMKVVESGDMKMSAGNRASVGFTQNKCRDWVLSSLSIPNLVCPPVFTALELKVLDSETRLLVYGPKIAGQAKTTDVPAWFGATLGTCLATDARGNPQWRLHLRDYCWPTTDPTPHKCKIRASAQLPSTELVKLPAFLADDVAAGDKPLTKFNLGYLFDRLEEVRRGALDAAEKRFPDAPGLKASTIGAAPASRRVVSAAAAAAATPGRVAAPAGLVRSGAASAASAPAAPVAPPVAPVVGPGADETKVVITPTPAAGASPATAPIAAAPAKPVTRRPPPAGIKPQGS